VPGRPQFNDLCPIVHTVWLVRRLVRHPPPGRCAHQEEGINQISTTARQTACSGRCGGPAPALVERRPRRRAAAVCWSVDPIKTGSGLSHLIYYEVGSLQQPNFSYCASASNWSAIGSPQLQQRSASPERYTPCHFHKGKPVGTTSRHARTTSRRWRAPWRQLVFVK